MRLIKTNRERERDRDRETERDTEREAERETEREAEGGREGGTMRMLCVTDFDIENIRSVPGQYDALTHTLQPQTASTPH